METGGKPVHKGILYHPETPMFVGLRVQEVADSRVGIDAEMM